MHLFRAVAIAGAGVALLAMSAVAQPSPKAAHAPAHSASAKTHRLIIQVTQNDPAVMNLALNNAENLVRRAAILTKRGWGRMQQVLAATHPGGPGLAFRRPQIPLQPTRVIRAQPTSMSETRRASPQPAVRHVPMIRPATVHMHAIDREDAERWLS